MLQRLRLKNIALVSEADIIFDEKLNILSGETGSGKSVILDSINFVLGSKADKTMIRYGEQELSVRAEFLVDKNCEAVKILEEYDIESAGEIIITRKFSLDGKGSVKINGNTVTSSMLKAVSQHLVDVHGQSEHFFLLNEDNQLKIIDGLLGDEGTNVKAELSGLIAKKRKIRTEISTLGGSAEERERQLDILNYQINEIESANLYEGEFAELKEKQNVIANAERILNSLSAVRSVLSDEAGCLDGIISAKRCLGGISSLSKEYSDICDRLESLALEIEDVSETVTDLADGVSFDDREAQETDERIALIKGLIKKYGADEKEILLFLDDAKRKAEILADSASLIEKYSKELTEIDGKIYFLCLKLTELRKNVCKTFCGKVVKELKSLNIPDADFSVTFTDYDKSTADLDCPNGADKISFAFSANKGEPLKPLNKVISGGEMSRFMLAVKTVLKDVNGISTYIFDEIDAGISGLTAKSVAKKFISIAENTQVIAVSHLPQICASGDAQFLIYKVEDGGKTFTKIKKLDDEEKIGEIIRLTGSAGTQIARQHAIELIKEFKSN